MFESIKNFFRGFAKKKEKPASSSTGAVKPPKLFYSKKLDPTFVKGLNKAIKKKSDITIKYKKKDGSVVTRKVTPYTAKGRNLVVGHDHERGELRSFRVDRIERLM